MPFGCHGRDHGFIRAHGALLHYYFEVNRQ